MAKTKTNQYQVGTFANFAKKDFFATLRNQIVSYSKVQDVVVFLHTYVHRVEYSKTGL